MKRLINNTEGTRRDEYVYLKIIQSIQLCQS